MGIGIAQLVYKASKKFQKIVLLYLTEPSDYLSILLELFR